MTTPFKGALIIARLGHCSSTIHWGLASDPPACQSGSADRILVYRRITAGCMIATSLGVPGFLLFLAALALIWNYFSLLERVGVRDDYLGLGEDVFCGFPCVHVG